MLMAKTISLFRCLGKTLHDPARLLAILNDEIVETASHGMFVTMVAGIFDPRTGDVVLANAGHQPPLLRHPEGRYGEVTESSPPLGVLPGMAFATQHLTLAGGRLYLFTDGVTEGTTENGDMLALSGVQRLLDAVANELPVMQLARVAAALQRSGERLHDDLTLLVIG